jgi:LPS-assembly lipoprotein
MRRVLSDYQAATRPSTAACIGVAARIGVAACIGAALALGGCGFRLAGSETLPTVLAKPYLSVRNPYSDFSREFERQLKTAGAMLQVGREGASATIDVSKDQVEQRILSVSARNIPTEYELIYTVVYSVHAGDKEVLTPQTIFLSRDYSFDETALLAKQNEADILREQMARDLVAIAMRRLSRLN